MLLFSIAQDYLVWHYSRAFKEIFHVWLNFIWFTVHFFSIPQLIKSWISPWKRITEGRNGSWEFEDIAGAIIIGFLTRVIGFVVRSIIICIGTVCLIIVILAGLLFYILWITLPILSILMILLGMIFLFT